MKVTKSVSAEAVKFEAEAFTGPQRKKLTEGSKQKYFQDIEVRHNGQEHFVFIPTPAGEKKVLEGQWIVTAEDGAVEILSDEAFKATWKQAKEKKPAADAKEGGE